MSLLDHDDYLNKRWAKFVALEKQLPHPTALPPTELIASLVKT